MTELNEGDIKHLEWLHDRMVHVYKENRNVDFLHKFRSIIKDLKGERKSYTIKSILDKKGRIIDARTVEEFNKRISKDVKYRKNRKF